MSELIHYVEGKEEMIMYCATTTRYYTLCGISWTKIKNEFVLHHISNALARFNLVTCRKCRKEMKNRGWLKLAKKGDPYPILNS